MKNSIIIILAIIAFSCSSTMNISMETIQEQQSVAETKEILSALSSDEMAGRQPGTEGFEMAAEYVEQYLKKHGIQPFFGESYRDTVVLEERTSYNIVGLVGKRKPNSPYILIGAHLDHIGTTAAAEDSIYNGTNDNATGVTAVLQIAKQLEQYNFDQNIVVALFTEEESGLAGSDHLAKRFLKDSIDLQYMLNFEMIGKTMTAGEDKVYVTGFSRSNLAEAINAVTGSDFVTFLEAEVQHNLFQRSDNYPFYNAFQIPAHTFSSFDFQNYPYYHHVEDEVANLDIENMNSIINIATYAIIRLLKEETAIALNTKARNE